MQSVQKYKNHINKELQPILNNVYGECKEKTIAKPVKQG